MRKRFTRASLLLGAALAMLVPTAGHAAADETQLCYVAVVIDEMPYVRPDPNKIPTIHIGLGDWHTEQTCIGPIGT